MMCTACQEACYCSRSCQLDDWKHGAHREECASLRKDRAGESFSRSTLRTTILRITLEGLAAPISPRDQAFIEFLATREMVKQQHSIRRSRDDELSDDPSAQKSFILFFDHAFNPSRFSLCTYDSLHAYDGDFYNFKDTQHRTSVDREPRKQLSTNVDIHVGVPYGSQYIYCQFPSNLASNMFGWADTDQQPNELTAMTARNRVQCIYQDRVEGE